MSNRAAPGQRPMWQEQAWEEGGDQSWHGSSAVQGRTSTGPWHGSLKRPANEYAASPTAPATRLVRPRLGAAPPVPPLQRWTSGASSASQGSNEGWAQQPWGVNEIGQQDKDDIQQWRECTPIGSNVPRTSIVPCKTPFEGSLADRAYAGGLIEDSDWFGREDLIRLCEEQGTPIGLVIDLVNTNKYYAGFHDGLHGVEYHKVRIPGRQVPERAVLESVFDLIDEFVARRPEEYVAIHCTHGINRTGFLVAVYLMTRADVPTARKAVTAFEKARGTKIDKDYLLKALLQLEAGMY